MSSLKPLSYANLGLAKTVRVATTGGRRQESRGGSIRGPRSRRVGTTL